MSKTELIEAISKSTGVSKKDCSAVIASFCEETEKAVKKGDKVTLIGFGTFSSSKRAARKGKNPQTGETIKIKATTVPKFKAGAEFKATVAKAK